MSEYQCVVGHRAKGKPAMIAFDGAEKYFACGKHMNCLLTTEQRGVKAE